MEEVLQAIQNNTANLIGKGEWVKDSRYLVYEYNGKYYAIIQCYPDRLYLMNDTLEEIPKEDIGTYV